MKKIAIADVTLREGVCRSDISLSFKEKLEVAKLLDKLGVNVIETAPIIDEKTDTLVLRTLCSLLKTSILSCPTGLTVEEVDRAWKAISSAAKSRLLVCAPVSAVQMEYLCHKKPVAMLDTISAVVSHAASLCADVEFAAQDATRSEKSFLFSAIKTAVEAGAKTVTVCDTSGIMLPDEFAQLIAEIYEAVPELSNVTLSVECSNAMDMANACVFACIKGGAMQIKTNIGGNSSPSTDSLANAIRIKGDSLGVSCDVNTMAISHTVPKILRMTTSDKSASVDAFSGMAFESRNANVLLDASAELSQVSKAVVELGYDLSDDDILKVYEAFKVVAAKKQVGTKELDSIVASEANQVPPTYKLVNYVINSGNIMTSTANIVLSKNGRELSAVEMGDGPIDAAFLTVEQIIGCHYELDDFEIQAVTEGRKALGEALVKLRSNGKIYSGRGISTDIIGASIHAYINALNKIVYEEN